MSTSMAGQASRFAAPSATAQPGLFAQLWRRRGTFLLVFALVTAATVGALRVLPVRYLASGAIIVAEPDSVTGNSSATWLQKLGDPADLESNLLLIRSPRLLRQVVSDPAAVAAIDAECEAASSGLVARLLQQLRPRRPCGQVAASEESRLEWAQARFSAGSMGRSRVIAVAYDSPLPEAAQRMANLLITAYLEDERAKRLESRLAGIAWLRQETAQLGDALQRDETAIEAFRRSHGLVRGQVAPLTSERLTETSQQLAQAQAAQAEAAARLQELGRGGAEARPVLESRTIADLKQQLAVAGAQLAGQSQSLGRNHPALAALQRERDELQGRIGAETARIVGGAQRSYAAASAQVAALSAQLDALKQEAGAAADSETQIASMVRDMEIKRTLYVDLSQRASQLETERRVITAGVQLVNLAELPTVPAFPKRVPFLVGGLTLAGILASGAALLRDKAAERGLRAPGALQALTSLAVLARIPAADRGRPAVLPGDRDLPLPAALEQSQAPSTLQEAIRGLYARLTLAGFGGGQRRTLLVTSSDAREGKTFVALALAQFAAASGRRVLLVECDLRRPGVQAALGLPPSPGLTEYLVGKAGKVPVVRCARRPGLDVVLAGETSMASTELLAGPRFAGLLQLAQDYDLVLLDSPPAGLLMDACVIASQVDGVLYCARWGRVEPERVASGLNDVRGAGGKVAGLVVTFTPQGEQAPYYGAALPRQGRLVLDGGRA